MKNKAKEFDAELKYCKEKVAEGHPSAHWKIRINEITALQKAKKGNKNVKSKTRKRS